MVEPGSSETDYCGIISTLLENLKDKIMSTEDKSLQSIELSGKHWDVWSEKFLARGKHKGYTKLLLCKKAQVRVDRVPTVDEYNAAVGLSEEEKEKVVKLGELN